MAVHRTAAATNKATSGAKTANSDKGSHGSKHTKGGSGKGAMKVFGVSLAGLSHTMQLLVLSTGAIVCASIFAALQEKVFVTKELKKHGGYVALLQTLTYAVCGFIEMTASGDSRKGSLRDYGIVSLLTQVGMLTTNWSLAYITYATRVIFKSSKILPTMAIGRLITGRKYSMSQYIVAGLLCAAVAVFTLGEKTPDFNIVGVLLISAGVVADALTSNFQEEHFFRTKGCSQAEVLTYGSLLGAGVALASLAYTGELLAGVEIGSQYPQLYSLTVVSSIMGYASVMFILVLIKHFSATVAEGVKSCRKIVTLVASFILFARPMNRNHWIGLALFVGSVIGGLVLKNRSERMKAAASAAERRASGEHRE